MHIMDGILSMPVIVTGTAGACAGIGIGLAGMKHQDIPKTAILASAFFVASMIKLPVGVTSVHLVLGGLLGIMLGWGAFPAIFAGLLLQMMMLGFGGWSTLGVNTFTIASPGVLCYLLLGGFLRKNPISRSAVTGFIAGFFSTFLSSVLVALCLVLTHIKYAANAGLEILWHLPAALLEGIICAFLLTFFARVKPELLEQNKAKNEL